MTSVLFLTDAHGRLVGFEAGGHAGYAESGSDIVCAAVSALTQAAVGGLEDVLHLSVTKREADGLFTARIDDGVAEDDLRDAQILLGTLKLSLTQLAEQYPQFIKIINRERRIRPCL